MRRRAILASVIALAASLFATPGLAGVSDPFEPEPIELEPVAPKPYVRPENGFSWNVPNRFGRDDDRDGVTDYHWNQIGSWVHEGDAETYDPAHVHPTDFPMNFNGCPTADERHRSRAGQDTANSYRWQVFDPSVPEGSTVYEQRRCHLRHVFHAQGPYTVQLTITTFDGTPYEGRTEPYEQNVLVRDFLIVSLGDSYASGEGNPDVPQVVNSSREPLHPLKTVDREARWADKRCHRSAWAGPALAAMAIEAADPHTSVTFLSFACSGATIDTEYFGGGNPLDPYARGDWTKSWGTGVLGPYRGADPPDGEDPPRWRDHLPSQMDQLTAAVTAADGSRRHIDALTISGGGNDVGFGPVAAVCVLYGNCPEHMVGRNGFLEYGVEELPLRTRFQQDADALSVKYDRLDAALRDPKRGLRIGGIYLTEYPDPGRNDSGRPCPEMLEDVVPPAMQPLLALGAAIHGEAVPLPWYHMEGAEVAWAAETVGPALNAQVAAAARRNGWTLVDGISTQFAGDGYGHGYCAQDSWIRRASESIELQGPYYDGLPPDTSKTKGTLHPNIAGHTAYRDRLLHHIVPNLSLLVPDTTLPTFESFLDVGDIRSWQGNNGWLIGRCPSGSSCSPENASSDSAVLRVEAFDPRGIEGARVWISGERTCTIGGCEPRDVPVCSTDGAVSCSPSPELLEDGKRYRWSFLAVRGAAHRLNFRVRATDGGVASYTREVRVDFDDPAATPRICATPDATGAYRRPLTVILEGVDPAPGSGLAAIEYQVDGGPLVVGGGDTKIDLADEGAHSISYQAVDWAGRRSPKETLSLNLQGLLRPGDLDPTFGTCGQVTTDFPVNPDFDYDYAHDVAIQPDGKIVAVGESTTWG